MKYLFAALLFAVMLPSQLLASPTWEKVPLATKAQIDAGMTGGEGFQYVHAIKYAPSDPSRVYFGVDTSGVWRSDDGGKNWDSILRGYLAHGTRSLAVDPKNPDIVFAAGFLGQSREDTAKYPQAIQGIYRTENGGKSWTLLRKALYFKQASKGDLFAFVPSHEEQKATQHIYAAIPDEGLLYSADSGKSWKQVWDAKLGTKTCEILDIKLIPGSGATPQKHSLLLATTEGLLCFTDRKVEKRGKGLPAWPRSIATTAADSRIVLAALGKDGIFYSEDSGQTFSRSAAPVFTAIISDVALSPVDATIAYARADQSSLRPLYSSDGGKSWSVTTRTNNGNLLEDEGYWYSSPFAPHPVEKLVALHVSNGRARILRTEDGGVSWGYSGNGFTGARMADMVFAANGDTYVGFTDHGVWLNRAGERFYTEVPLERMFKAKSVSAMAFDGSSMLIASGAWSTQGIAFGEIGKNGMPNWHYSSDTSGRLRAAFMLKNPPFWGVGNYISQNQGDTWTQLSKQVFAYAGEKQPLIFAVETTPENKAVIQISQDSGKSWKQLGPVLPLAQVSITDVLPVLKNDTVTTVLVASSNGIYKLKQGRWQQYGPASGLTEDAFGNVYVGCLTADPVTPDTIYAGRRSVGYGRSNGVFVSHDGGESWKDANYNMVPENIFAIKVDPRDKSIYIGTSLGLFRLKQ